jgi:hypothetical protein
MLAERPGTFTHSLVSQQSCTAKASVGCRCSTRVGRVDVELLERQSALTEAKLACG